MSAITRAFLNAAVLNAAVLNAAVLNAGVLIGGVLIGGALLLAPAAAHADDPTRVLRVIPSADVATLDPTRASNQIGRIYAQMVFDTLYALDNDLNAKPMMVDSEAISPDRLTYTFTLRQGLKFHDGSPVTSRDVVASINRWMGGSSNGSELKSRLASMTVVDARTLAMTLKQPFGLLEFLLGGAGAPIAGIMREADANRSPDIPITEPIGSGPFRYVAAERISGQRVVFERFADYLPRDEPPSGSAGGRHVNVDRVIWTIVPDPTTAANALVTGEADFWDTVTPDLAGFLRQHGIIVRRTASLPAVAWIRPNFEHPPFNDRRARQALALLTDQSEYMAAVAGSAPWTECHSFSVCGSTYGSEVGSEAYRQANVEKARQLLKEAGYKGEKIVVVGTPQLPIINVMSQILAQRLRDAGMNVELDMGDWTTVYQRMTTRGLPIGAGGWNVGATYSMGGTMFSPLTNTSLDTSCGAAATSRMGFPCDEEGVRLRQAALAAPDEPSRKIAFDALQRYMWDFVPYVPAGQYDQLNAYRPNISGVLGGYVVTYWNIVKK